MNVFGITDISTEIHDRWRLESLHLDLYILALTEFIELACMLSESIVYNKMWFSFSLTLQQRMSLSTLP